jgi:hypothetical protein
VNESDAQDVHNSQHELDNKKIITKFQMKKTGNGARHTDSGDEQAFMGAYQYPLMQPESRDQSEMVYPVSDQPGQIEMPSESADNYYAEQSHTNGYPQEVYYNSSDVTPYQDYYYDQTYYYDQNYAYVYPDQQQQQQQH